MSVKRLVKLSAIAAVYVVLTVALQPISFGQVQFRLSEILVLLCFFRKDYIYSITVGCLISNFFSPMPLDFIFGTLQTIVAVVLISVSKNMLIASLYPVITMPIIALELYIALNLPFWESVLWTMVGEFVVVVLVAYPVFSYLRKNQYFLELIEANQNVEVYREF